MRLSKSLFDNAIKALSFCQMGLMGNCINIRSNAYIYASDKEAEFILWPLEKRRASFFHIVGWLKNLQIRHFAIAWHRGNAYGCSPFFCIYFYGKRINSITSTFKSWDICINVSIVAAMCSYTILKQLTDLHLSVQQAICLSSSSRQALFLIFLRPP